MEYFSIKSPLFIVPSEKCRLEFEKIDKFMNLLENSGVGKIIEYVKLKGKKVGKALDYANRNNIPYVVILGKDEVENGKFKIKKIKDGTEVEATFTELENLEL